ncbi:PEP/pyruvate-binding domain-containing protein [Natrialba taiwanensis]|uniref:Probable phosphoenolpyruvate synthase n=1 Tax=Natrialba taiwanensis DSM 12281 TaxID=1230458 RepID=L9ZMU7_9EURY|nr:PEP/pyruvate-binding domain-containing protein [Natrialba taiwanensis]ELY86468.1 pyruvate phosphate dikinase PEP/pyruvate-binding protein [Natrialba taiwanensis DSM 12281]
MSESEDIQTGTYVVGFDDAGATDSALVGGKGANLARLVGADLPVPAGFCVTTAAYEALVDDSAIEDAINELAALEPTDTAAIADAGATLRTRIEDCDVPEEVQDAIEAAVDETASDPEQAYAVRSSATAEDLPEASFAGQQETFLNVRGADEIVDRVRACMGSLFTDRAIAYRARNDIPHEDVALAVVVQRMVSSDVSGILFTADPMTGNRHVSVIEGGLGLGEAFVSGEMAADTVRVDTRTKEILNYDVSDQQRAIRPLPEGGTETIDLTSAERTIYVLSDEQVLNLVELGTQIEAIFERPQDIEWCITDDEIYVVQARPITSLFPVPSPEPSDDRLHVYVSMGHIQAFAEAMPPLVRDLWMSFIQTMYVEFGFGADTQWAVEAGGRVYIDMTTQLRISSVRDRLPDQLEATSEPASAGVEDILRRRGDEFRKKRSIGKTITAVPRLAAAAWTGARTGYPLVSAMLDGFVGSFIGEPAPPEHEKAKWVDWGQNIAEQVRAPDTPEERAHAVFNQLDEVIQLPSVGPLLAAFTAGSRLERLCPEAQEDINAIGRGFPDELVTQINLGLGDLADVARARPEVANALRQNASLEEIASLEGGEDFVTAFEEYLDEFGHRATGEMDISRPRWREDPAVLLEAVGATLDHGQTGEHHEHILRIERDALEAAERLEQRADHGLFGPVRRRLVHRLIRTYRAYIQTREYPKQGLGHIFTAWHEALRDTGELLVTEGLLDRSEDVWFLRKDELFTALDGDSIDVDIEARRAEFERHTALDAPPVLTSEGEAPNADIEREDVPEDALVGTDVSGGVVEGPARVVHDPAEETIETGEILIAPSSDPGWTPLFLNAAGIVVEVGGRLSHGALVAREYGLPGVVSVTEATQRIETGDHIRVNGNRGTVELLDRSEQSAAVDDLEGSDEEGS